MWDELYDQADSMGRAQAQPPSSRPVAARQPPCNPLRSCPAADLHLPACAAPRLPFSRPAPALHPAPTQPCPLRVRAGALTELGAGGARHPPHPPATPGWRHRGRRHRGRGSRRGVHRAAARARCRRGRHRLGCGHTGGRARLQGGQEQEEEEEEEALSARVCVWVHCARVPKEPPVAAAAWIRAPAPEQIYYRAQLDWNCALRIWLK